MGNATLGGFYSWMVLPTLDDRNWYPVSYECGSGRCLRCFDGIFAAFEIADVSFSGWWKSYIQGVDKSQNYLNMANVQQCSKIENQENGREFEIGIIGNVAQKHDADTWWFVIYNSVPDNMFGTVVDDWCLLGAKPSESGGYETNHKVFGKLSKRDTMTYNDYTRMIPHLLKTVSCCCLILFSSCSLAASKRKAPAPREHPLRRSWPLQPLQSRSPPQSPVYLGHWNCREGLHG